MSVDLRKNLYYEIQYTFKFPGNASPDYVGNDTFSLYHIRCAYLKTSSFAFMTVPVEFTKFRQIQDAVERIEAGKDPLLVDIEYWIIDHAEMHNRNYKRIKLLTKKQFYVLNCQTLQRDIIERYLDTNISVPCRLMLVNPTLYTLGTTLNTFNKKYWNVVPIDIIKDFSKYLEDEYKDTFQTKFIHTDKNIHDFKYEHIIARADNDMILPKQINDMYKTYKYPCFIFFDDFAINNENKKDVLFLHMCLESCQTPGLEPIDIYKEPGIDSQFGTVNLKKISMMDRDSIFNYDPDSTRFTVRDEQGYHKSYWLVNKEPIENYSPKLSVKIPVSTIANELDPIQLPRTILSNTFDKSTVTKDNLISDFFKLYAPDGVDQVNNTGGEYRGWWDRFRMTEEFFKRRILAFYQMTSQNVHCDFYQFYRTYNFDNTDITDFSFQPIAIANIFRRLEPKNTACMHTAKTVMLRYNWELIGKGEM
jgi:hypothetical protein